MLGKKRNGSVQVFDIFNYLAFSLMVFVCVYPFYYVFIFSISDPTEVSRGVILFPAGFSIFNYMEVFRLKGILGAFGMSVLRTVSGTVLTIFCCSLYGFLVTQDKLPFRKFFYRFAIITMYLNAGLIPTYLTLRAYGLRNNFLIYILPAAISAFFIVLIKTFMEQLPPSLEESARIDGAGHFTVFARIIFPLSKPILATIAVFAAVGQWNSWFDNYLYCPAKELKTLQLVLYNFLNEAQNKANALATTSAGQLANMKEVTQISPEGVRMTITMIAALPIIMVYPFLQKYFVKGIMLGAIKG